MKITGEGLGIVQVSVKRDGEYQYCVDIHRGHATTVLVFEEIRLSRDPKRSTSTNAAVRVSP